MIKEEFTNYRVEPSETAFKIIATNPETGRDELIKYTTKQAYAYSYVNRKNRDLKYKIHSNRIKQIMFEKGLTYEKLSEMIGRNKNTIMIWANNRKQPSYGSILLMAQTLNIKPEDLINF